MSRYELLHGDCLEKLKGLADNSVDAVVTDPPYELAFMGKAWDASGIAYDVGLWREVLRVLKPGGHLLAFGATRTYHRLAVAIEDAGFEVRDSIHWLYGCLSEDTEILVNGEWCHYSKAIEGSLTLCYDVEHDSYSWQPVQNQFLYPYDDTAYRLIGERTDQLVSRNHRCLVQRDGRWQFVVAEEVAREQEARVPVLETLPELLDALCLPESYASTSELVLCGMFDDQSKSAETKVFTQNACGNVCGLRDSVSSSSVLAQEGAEANLLSSMQREIARFGACEALSQGTEGLDGRELQVQPHQNVGGEESRVEGRGDVQAEQGQLHRAEVCSMSAGVPTDGPQGRLCDGASSCGCDGAGALLGAERGCASCGSRHAEQRPVEPNAVCDQQGPQAVRGERFTVSDLVRVEAIHLTGKVWCVKVPTGSFVARRNGKVFVTGNSGFPKSLDVSKAIDKAAGAERPVIGKAKAGALSGNSRFNDAPVGTISRDHGNPTQGYKCGDIGEYDVTAPATDAARQWEGFGTALKPSHEPVVKAVKHLTAVPAMNRLLDECSTLIGRLAWLKSNATHAELDFTLSHQGFGAAIEFASARWPVERLISEELEEQCEPMDMSKSPEPDRIIWSIATSWRSILGVLWSDGSMFTTETASSTITALKTLRFSLLAITQENMRRPKIPPSGEHASVGTADQSLRGSSQQSTDIRTHFADELVTTPMLFPVVSSLVCTAESVLTHHQATVEGSAHPNAPTDTTTGSEKINAKWFALSVAVQSLLKLLEKQSSADEHAWQYHTESPSSHEPIVVARKPLTGTVAANVLEWGTGGINIDACRLQTGKTTTHSRGVTTAHAKRVGEDTVEESGRRTPQNRDEFVGVEHAGRWPPNVIFSHLPECRQVGTKRVKGGAGTRCTNRDGQGRCLGHKNAGRSTSGETFHGPDTASPNGLETVEAWDCAEGCAVAELDAQSGVSTSKAAARGGSSPNPMSWGKNRADGAVVKGHTDSGGASRFFPAFRYQAKAPSKERKVEGVEGQHPTQKPVDLMRWLVRLVTPRNGLVLDPFTGSGTTGVAAILEGFRFIGCEREDEYYAIANARLDHAIASANDKKGVQPTLFDLEAP